MIYEYKSQLLVLLHLPETHAIFLSIPYLEISTIFGNITTFT